MRRHRVIMNKKKWLATPYMVWAVGFIIIPLLMILFYGITTKEDGSFTMENLLLIADPLYRKALWLSLKLSIISTLICLIVAYPLAMLLVKKNVNSGSFIIMVFMLPMWMNFLLRTIAWQNLLEKTGVINAFLNFLGLPSMSMINTSYAIVLGMVYNFLPFMIQPIYNVLAKIDKNVTNAARDLGANSFQTFMKVTLPLSMPGVISGITMVFVPSLTTFVISNILGGNKIVLIGNLIEQQFKTINNWNAGAGMSVVLMVFVLVSMALVNKTEKEAED